MSAPRRPHILHVGKFYPPHKGGMESHLQDLCRELSKAVTVEVLVASEDRRGAEEQDREVRVRRLGTAASVRGTSICPALPGAIRRSPAELLHVHLPNPAAVLATLLGRRRRPLLVTYHSDIVRQRLLRALLAPLHAVFLHRAQAVIVASPLYLESSRLLRAWRAKCRVIPYGIDLEPYRPVDPAAVARLRRRHGPRIILAVGRLIYYKGFEHLITAMAQVDARLLLIGAGPLADRLRAQVRTLGLGDKVSLLGEVDDAVPYYQACDVFALPSIARSEAFGIVQLEAMACGKPVVNTRLTSGVPFVSPDGVSGLTVPPGDPHVLAAALNRLLADPVLRVRLGEAGRGRVEEQFTVELMARRTRALYDEVLRANRGSPSGGVDGAGC